MDARDEEPDEFARLLAQLNGTPEPAAPVEPVLPSSVPPSPVLPGLVLPSPGAPPVGAQAPVAPVAPAFGETVPYPTQVTFPQAAPITGFPVAPAPLTFPTVEPAVVAPVPTQLPLAPELMGADELAAPPRPFPPLYETTPPLVSPPEYDPPQPYAVPQPVDAPQPYLPPPAPEPVQAAPLQPAPVVPPVASPVAVGPALTAPSPRDFASLLSTPVGSDDDPNVAAPLLAFGSGSSDDDEPDLARSTAGEKIGLALAVLVAPIGLIVGIVAGVRSARRRGWVIGIVRASIAIAAVLSVVLAIGGYFGYTQFKQQQQHDQIAAASAGFCAAIKADPTMVQLPTFGWPAVGATIPDTLKAMQAYEDRWTKLVKVSPAGIKPDVNRVAIAAKAIIDSVTSARIVDDSSNVAAMSSVASDSGVPAWHSEYCG